MNARVDFLKMSSFSQNRAIFDRVRDRKNYLKFPPFCHNCVIYNTSWLQIQFEKKKTFPKYKICKYFLNECAYFYSYYFLSLSTTTSQFPTDASSFGWPIGWNFAQEIKNIHYYLFQQL